MTNSVALVLGIVIVGALAADFYWSEAQNIVFLGKKLAELIEWLAFWR